MTRDRSRDDLLILTWPDRSLRLRVARPDGDLTIGFDGYGWHTHGSILAAEYGVDESEALGLFIHDLIEGRRVASVLKRGDEILDAVISDGPVVDDYLELGEAWEMRPWRAERPDDSRHPPLTK